MRLLLAFSKILGFLPNKIYCGSLAGLATDRLIYNQGDRDARGERSFITSGPSVHVSVTKMSYMLLLVLFSILSFGFLFFRVHHLCMPLLGPELVNKILVSCIMHYSFVTGHAHSPPPALGNGGDFVFCPADPC